MPTLTQVLRELTLFRANACTLIREGTPRLLISVLEAVRDFKHDTVSMVVELLWNLLEHSASSLSDGEVMAFFCCCALRLCFCALLLCCGALLLCCYTLRVLVLKNGE
jgi:hypothetical protein